MTSSFLVPFRHNAKDGLQTIKAQHEKVFTLFVIATRADTLISEMVKIPAWLFTTWTIISIGLSIAFVALLLGNSSLKSNLERAENRVQDARESKHLIENELGALRNRARSNARSAKALTDENTESRATISNLGQSIERLGKLLEEGESYNKQRKN